MAIVKAKLDLLYMSLLIRPRKPPVRFAPRQSFICRDIDRKHELTFQQRGQRRVPPTGVFWTQPRDDPGIVFRHRPAFFRMLAS